MASPTGPAAYVFVVWPGNNSKLIRDALLRRPAWSDGRDSLAAAWDESPPTGRRARKAAPSEPAALRAFLTGDWHFSWRPTQFIKYDVSGGSITMHSEPLPAGRGGAEKKDATARQLVNHMPGLAALTTKTGLIYSLRAHSARCRGGEMGAYRLTPTTFLVRNSASRERNDMKAFLAHFRALSRRRWSVEALAAKHCRRNLWIVKPARANQGRGIQVFKSLPAIQAFIGEQAESRQWVVQKYLERPLLIHGRKFDIRIWACVLQNGDTYVYHNGYLRTSSSPFTLDVTSDGKGGSEAASYVHLTNNCLQKHGGEYGTFEEGNTLSFSQFQDYLDEHNGSAGISVEEHIRPRMHWLIAESISSVAPVLDDGNRGRAAFELYGYDFMIDEDYRVWLIEVNTNPYLGVQNSWHAKLLPHMVEDLMRIAVDPIFPGPPAREPPHPPSRNDWKLVFSTRPDSGLPGLTKDCDGNVVQEDPGDDWFYPLGPPSEEEEEDDDDGSRRRAGSDGASGRRRRRRAAGGGVAAAGAAAGDGEEEDGADGAESKHEESKSAARRPPSPRPLVRRKPRAPRLTAEERLARTVARVLKSVDALPPVDGEAVDVAKLWRDELAPVLASEGGDRLLGAAGGLRLLFALQHSSDVSLQLIAAQALPALQSLYCNSSRARREWPLPSSETLAAAAFPHCLLRVPAALLRPATPSSLPDLHAMASGDEVIRIGESSAEDDDSEGSGEDDDSTLAAGLAAAQLLALQALAHGLSFDKSGGELRSRLASLGVPQAALLSTLQRSKDVQRLAAALLARFDSKQLKAAASALRADWLPARLRDDVAQLRRVLSAIVGTCLAARAAKRESARARAAGKDSEDAAEKRKAEALAEEERRRRRVLRRVARKMEEKRSEEERVARAREEAKLAEAAEREHRSRAAFEAWLERKRKQAKEKSESDGEGSDGGKYGEQEDEDHDRRRQEVMAAWEREKARERRRQRAEEERVKEQREMIEQKERKEREQRVRMMKQRSKRRRGKLKRRGSSMRSAGSMRTTVRVDLRLEETTEAG